MFQQVAGELTKITLTLMKVGNLPPESRDIMKVTLHSRLMKIGSLQSRLVKVSLHSRLTKVRLQSRRMKVILQSL
ncbi:hypothetical protein M8J75_006076 [Diaphorina citri]|nr:hypothetical protein M8J75_006076 [Diaphorina citri]